MKKILLPILALIAAAAPLAAVAESPKPAAAPQFSNDGPLRHAFRGALRRWLAFRDETPLSDAHRSQVREILRTHRGEIQTQITAARQAHTALHKAIAQPKPDETEVNTAASAIAESARSGALLRAKLAREIRPLLTAEQRERIDAAIEEFSSEIGQVATAL